MCKLRFKGKFSTFILLFGMLSLASCNFLGSKSESNKTLDVTQAYQTVEARLTQEIAKTKLVATTPAIKEPTVTIATPTGGGSTQTSVITSTPSQPSATKPAACDSAAAGNPIDVTIPDDSVLQPGEPFTKVWRLVNVGTCTWTTDYSVAFFSGEQMSGPGSAKLPTSVSPGATVEISVDLVAPLEAGTYQGDWKLKNAANEWFGIGPDGGSAFWVRIVVPEVTTTVTPTVTSTVTPMISPTVPTPSDTPSPTIKVSGSAQLNLSDAFDLDNNQLNPGGGTDITYELQNGSHVLKAVNSAKIAVFGGSAPTIDHCQPANVTGTEVTLENISPGTFLCEITDVGSPGWISYSSLDDTSQTLSIQFLVWQTP